MEKLVGKNNNLLVKWRLLKNDGAPFAIDGIICKPVVVTGRGRSEVKSFSISGADKNIVSWVMNVGELRFVGSATLRIVMLSRGLQVAQVEQKHAFRVVPGNARECDCTQILELTSFVNVLHPECVPGAVNILFPTLEVDENMHLILSGDTEQYAGNFSLDEEDGHLFFNNDIDDYDE